MSVVAVVFILAGLGKVMHPDEIGTMVSRYLKSPEAVRALGLCEIGLALWMLSGFMPRFSGTVAIAVLGIFTLLILVELQKNQPLPCGCLEVKPGQMDPHTVRKGLWMSVGRNIALGMLTIVSIVLTEPVARLRSRN